MYCIHCGKNNKKNTSDVCSKCGQPLLKRELSSEETKDLSKALYTKGNTSRENVDNGLVFVVLGATLLVIGILFFFLSFKLDQTTYEKYLNVTCSEFWVSMVGLFGGGGMLIYGLIRVIYELVAIQKPTMRAIRNIKNNNYVHFSQDEKKILPSSHGKK